MFSDSETISVQQHIGKLWELKKCSQKKGLDKPPGKWFHKCTQQYEYFNLVEGDSFKLSRGFESGSIAY
jgi:hypothetical protein